MKCTVCGSEKEVMECPFSKKCTEHRICVPCMDKKLGITRTKTKYVKVIE